MGWSVFVAAVVFFVVLSSAAQAKIVVTIRPLHAMVSAVLGDFAEPVLLLENNVSPHHFTPSYNQVRQLETAEMVFWIGPGFETGLAKTMANLGSGSKPVAMMDSRFIHRIAYNRDRTFLQPQYQDAIEDHDGHDDHGDHDDHAMQEFDPHIWLDPVNAGLMLKAIALELGSIFPHQQQEFMLNAQRMQEDINILTMRLMTVMEPNLHKHFVVYHNAYEYFFQYFGFRDFYALTSEDEHFSPSASRVMGMRRLIDDYDIECVFSERQFSHKLVETMVEGIEGVRVVMVDPLGTEFRPGSNLYLRTLKTLALTINDCLNESH